MKDGMESSVYVLKDGLKSMELAPLAKRECFTTQLQKYVKTYVESMKLLLMEQTVSVKKTFTELTEFVLNVQLDQDSDYKQAHAFLVIKIKYNGIRFVFVKLISISLMVLVVNVLMEQPTIKTNKFVTVCVPDSTKFGMEKDVYVPKDLIVSTEYVPDVQLVQFITETVLFAKIFVN